MGKGGYSGGSTIISGRNKTWFSNAKPQRTNLERLTPEQRLARIVELNGETEHLQAQLRSVAAQLRVLHDLVRADEATQRAKERMRDHMVKTGTAWDRREVSLKETADALFRPRK